MRLHEVSDAALSGVLLFSGLAAFGAVAVMVLPGAAVIVGLETLGHRLCSPLRVAWGPY